MSQQKWNDLQKDALEIKKRLQEIDEETEELIHCAHEEVIKPCFNFSDFTKKLIEAPRMQKFDGCVLWDEKERKIKVYIKQLYCGTVKDAEKYFGCGLDEIRDRITKFNDGANAPFILTSETLTINSTVLYIKTEPR